MRWSAEGALRATGREEFSNELGRGLRLSYRLDSAPPALRRFEPPEELERRLDLLFGVGPRTRERLRQEGYETIADACRHPRFGKVAAKVMAALANRDVKALMLAGAKDAELVSLFRPEAAVVVDIETTGLARVLPLFLIGMAFPRPDGGWEIVQLLAREFGEERAVLRQAQIETEGVHVCVSYNGKAFDEPFAKARFRLHGLAPMNFRLHVDLLHACRRRYGKTLPDCRLPTVCAHVFGLARFDDISGEAAPDLYFQYVQQRDEAAIRPVLEHNAMDVGSLAWLHQAAYAWMDERKSEGEGAGDVKGA